MKPNGLWIAIAALVVLAVTFWSWRARSDREAARRESDASTSRTEIARDEIAPTAAVDGESASRRTPEEEPAARDDGASAPPSSKRSVRLIDDLTGEPVPHFAVRLQPGATDHSSDAEGRFEWELPAEMAELSLEFVENTSGTPDRIQTRREAAAAIATGARIDPVALEREPFDVRVPVGPTYRLDAALPPGYDASEVFATLRSSDPTQMFDVASANVRDPSALWVRFRATARVMSGGPTWRLALETRDGLWYGAALVANNVGIASEPVRIEFEARARLEGRVIDELGGAVEEGLVRIEREGASFSNPDNRPLFGLVGAGGTFRLNVVPPGDYTVFFDRKRYRDFRAKITLERSQTRVLDITLEKLPASELGRIEGRVESDSGQFHETLYTYLRPVDSNVAPSSGRVEWSVIEGRHVGRFEFDQVELGEYVVRVSGSGLRPMEPVERSVRPGDAPHLFRVRDGGERGSVMFTVVDAGGAPLPKFTATLALDRAEGELVGRATGKDGQATIEGAPLDMRCRYKVSAADHQPVWGEHVVAREANTLRVTLQPGWGTEVFVRGTDGSPVTGARIYFDGELAGESDARGELRVALPREPQLARVEHFDWTLSPQSGLSPEGRFRVHEPFLNIVLEAPRR